MNVAVRLAAQANIEALKANPLVQFMQERNPSADFTEFAYKIRYTDITFECLRRARKIVNRLDGPAGPCFPDEALPSPRGRKIGHIVTLLRAKQCAREGIPMPASAVAEYLDALRKPLAAGMDERVSPSIPSARG